MSRVIRLTAAPLPLAAMFFLFGHLTHERMVAVLALGWLLGYYLGLIVSSFPERAARDRSGDGHEK
jgi:hypothetical protein